MLSTGESDLEMGIAKNFCLDLCWEGEKGDWSWK